FEGALDRASGLQVPHLDTVEGLALAGLDELVLDDGVWIAVEQDFETPADLTGGVTGHGCFSRRDRPECAARSKGPRMIAAFPRARQRPRRRRRPPHAASHPPPPAGAPPHRLVGPCAAGSARRLTRTAHNAVLECAALARAPGRPS